MYSTLTIKELLEAKEGERVQFKEAKNRFDSNEAARCCCALANCGGENGFWFLKFPVGRLAFLYRQTASHGGMRETV